MTAEKVDNDEFEERAATLEFEAGMPRAEAELRAGQEIVVRNTQANIHVRREEHKQQLRQDHNQQGQQQQLIPQEKRSGIKALQDKLEQTGNKMRALTDSARKDELFGQWMEILNQIIELRKAK